MYYLYNLLILIIILISSPFIFYKIIFSPQWRKGLKQRFGIGLPQDFGGDYIWFHAASVGEVRVTATLIRRLKINKPQTKIIMSVMTFSGKNLAEQLLNTDEIKIIYVPLDFVWNTRRVIKKINPKILVLVETELWPNLIKEAKNYGCKIVLVNGRISNKSYPLYKNLKIFWRQVLDRIDLFGVQTEEYKKRLENIGVTTDKIKVTGNVKYDQFHILGEDLNKFYEEFNLEVKDLIWVTGSIRLGEEEMILDAFQRVKKEFPQLKLILAPRHLERVAPIKNLLNNYKISYICKTEINHDKVTKSFSCILLDTIGDLLKAYAIGSLAFMGGSLVPKGGQNILEPAYFSKPVLFGPYIDNFLEEARTLIEAGGGIQVEDARELSIRIRELLAEPGLIKEMGAKAYQHIIERRGATDKNINLIESLLNGNQC